MSSSSPSPEEREIVERLEAMLDVARSLAHERIDRTSEPDAPIAPFAVAWSENEQRLLDLTDVASDLATPRGMNRLAHTLISRYGADTFAAVTSAVASETGDAEHPQAREVVRIILGHESGFSGSAFCDVNRTPDGPRLTGVWQTNEDAGE